MRDYAKVSSRFWTAGTGKALRGDGDAQRLALYLMTSPHSNMIGVFTCPILYMAHEIGMDFEGASKALARLINEGFCTYEEASETIWVHEMARWQIGESLDPKDKQIKGIQKQYENIAEPGIKQGFFIRYGTPFCLVFDKPHECPLEAPPKPGTGERAEDRERKGGAEAQSKYRWEGKVIRLAAKDYDSWKVSYPHIIDFDAELNAADCYYHENPNPDGKWFFPVSNWLKKANNEALEKSRVVPLNQRRAPRQAGEQA